eukprot:TRINITY_DN25220_c0_g1_i1.p1 TRINITY_DN25220_c0_g1~~TRINITY_DN25220_c0_g1_i1.p1  ORF type:complete len:1284 (+),score=182.52 TRINITY_DN25220_c0_g1_i1:164-4015(+)
MEVIAAVGLGAKELFSYNRTNFKFDQEQRIERESLRIEMQVKRFELFREDVRDLVELTVDRMDVYHLVGALFLEFCIVLFCEGRVQASAPPFLLSMFLLSNACAFIYLLLAVWLSMHASIASHSFGVRLLTRFVRLPIPSVKQMTALRSNLKDYERQNISNLLRLPFLDRQTQEWDTSLHVKEEESKKKRQQNIKMSSDDVRASSLLDKSSSSSSAIDTSKKTSVALTEQTPSQNVRLESALPQAGRNQRQSSSYVSMPRSAASSELHESHGCASSSSKATKVGRSIPPSSKPAPKREASRPKELTCIDSSSVSPSQMACAENDNLLPDHAESPLLGGQDLLEAETGALPERHVQLFRKLQSKWQCYDAYCRVCMGLGVNQILQGLSYYGICHTLVENHSPTTGYALVVLFQSTTIAIAVLDLAGLKRREILAVQIVGIMPCLITAFGVASGNRDELGKLEPNENYTLSPLSFLFQVFWLELWLRVAAPSDDQAKLPRRFRQVLFLDVFGDATGWEPTRAEDEQDKVLDNMLDQSFEDLEVDDRDEQEDVAAIEALEHMCEQAATQLTLAQSAVRRWKSVPSWAMSPEQSKDVNELQEQLNSWGNTINVEVNRDEELHHQLDKNNIFENPLRHWHELSSTERETDPFAKCLVGPFEHDEGFQTVPYHFDVERQAPLFEDARKKEAPGALLLTLQATKSIIIDLEKEARLLLESRITRDLRLETLRRQQVAVDNDAGCNPHDGQEEGPEVGVGSDSAAVGGLQDNNNVTPIRTNIFNPLAASLESFPNLVKLFTPKKPRHDRPLDETGMELLSMDSPTCSTPRDASSSRFGFGERSDGVRSPRVSRKKFRRRRRQDPTLVAMAGENARHFVPERLPWQVLSRMTRVLQICWFYTGLMALLKELHWYQADFQEHPASEQRRLRMEEALEFERLNVQWPHGALFRPTGLACPYTAHGYINDAVLVVNSPFAIYTASGLKQLPEGREESQTMTAKLVSLRLQLEELQRELLPSSTVLLCPPRGLPQDNGMDDSTDGVSSPAVGLGVYDDRHLGRDVSNSSFLAEPSRVIATQSSLSTDCLLATPTIEGVRIWSFGRSEEGSLLLVDGKPWKLLTGGIVRCTDVAWLLPANHETADSTWCLILAGWDGELLPVAAVPLLGESVQPPLANTWIWPLFDAPLYGNDADQGILALHMETHRGRLWALVPHVGGIARGVDLEAWDVPGLRRLGRRRIRFPLGFAGFRPVALCEDEVLGLLAVGRSDSTGPALLRAALPAEVTLDDSGLLGTS